MQKSIENLYFKVPNNKFQICGDPTTRRVTIDGVELNPEYSQSIYNHSPDGFNWGYGGSGPSQLALAILLETTKDLSLSKMFYQDFKWEFIANGDHNLCININMHDWIKGKLNKIRG